MLDGVVSRIEGICLAGVPFRNLRALFDVRFVVGVGLLMGTLLRFLNSRRRAWHGHMLPNDLLSLDVRATSSWSLTATAVHTHAHTGVVSLPRHAPRIKGHPTGHASVLPAPNRGGSCSTHECASGLAVCPCVGVCVCLLQMAAVFMAVLCCVYLVAFAGVPVVLSVMTDGKRDKEAFEVALRNANVGCAPSTSSLWGACVYTSRLAWIVDGCSVLPAPFGLLCLPPGDG
jgi:Flp pilus assembly protein TadB